MSDTFTANGNDYVKYQFHLMANCMYVRSGFMSLFKRNDTFKLLITGLNFVLPSQLFYVHYWKRTRMAHQMDKKNYI